MHAGDDEVLLSHGLLKLVDSSLGVTVDDGLLDVQVGVQVEENIDFPLVLLHGNIVLVDTFEGKVFLLDKDLGRVSQEMLGEAKNLGRQGSREEADLDVGGQELENVLDLGLETTGEHLVSLVKNEELQVVRLEEASPHHVVHAAWGANDNVCALLEDADVLSDYSTTDTSVHLDSEVLANGVDDEGDLHGQLTGG